MKEETKKTGSVFPYKFYAFNPRKPDEKDVYCAHTKEGILSSLERVRRVYRRNIEDGTLVVSEITQEGGDI